jgi:hypothetical protein
LSPSAGVQDDQAIAGDLVGLDRLTEHSDILPRIQKRKDGWGGMAIDNRDLFAKRLQDPGHSKFAAQGIAVGPDVARQNESMMRSKDRNQFVPGEGHEGHF